MEENQKITDKLKKIDLAPILDFLDAINFKRIILITIASVITLSIISSIFINIFSAAKGRELYQKSWATPKAEKWKTIPPAPEFSDNYDWQDILNRVMTQLSKSGPKNNIPDNWLDSKDWATTFLILWYNTFSAPDGTCLIVRNYNAKAGRNRFDQTFIAIWADDEWKLIDPRACNEKDCSMEFFWGKKYDSRYNIWSSTKAVIKMMEKYDSQFQRDLIEKTKTEEIYGLEWLE